MPSTIASGGMENNNILHLDRLTLPDLGKFSMILSSLLTTEQRAKLNTEYPEMMMAMGAFESNAPPVSTGPVPQDVIQACKNDIAANRKIAAIKKLRAATGIMLKEAKEWCDRLQSEM